MTSNTQYYVLDFDRTLADTEKLHNVLEQVIEQETTITVDELKAARQKVEQAGSSFDTVDYIKQLLVTSPGARSWLDLEQVFVTKAHKEDMLLPGAKELMTLLDQKQIPYGMITYGNEAWQLAKIEAANLASVPHVVTHLLHKGELLKGWQQPDHSFVIPPALTRDFTPMTVSEIIFLDDKAKSFTDIPPGVKGLYVQPLKGGLLPSQQGSVPEGVRVVKGLFEAIKLLFS